jgi:single-strand DNA-binding protein
MPQLIDAARIANDPVMRHTQDGTAVLGLSLPCDYGRKGQDGKKPTQWVDASLWGKQAEALAPYLVKGQWIAFTLDDAHIEEYQSGGTTRSKLVGRVSNIKLIGGKPEGQQAAKPQTSGQNVRNAPAAQKSAYDNFDDDVPF